MRSWNFENGVSVEEIDYNYDLHAFACYHNEEYIGTIYPSTIEDMESCIKELNDGNDPVSNGWEDGCGNTCEIDGWGDALIK